MIPCRIFAARCSISEIACRYNIIDFQYQCLKSGLNAIGIPDLIIAQNALQNHCEIYTLDTHFEFMRDILNLQVVER